MTWDGEPRTATPTLTQLLSSVQSTFSVASRPQRPQGLLWTGNPGRPHRLSHTSEHSSSVQCCFTSTETARTVRDGCAQGGHFDFHTAPELCSHLTKGVQFKAWSKSKYISMLRALLGISSFSQFLASFWSIHLSSFPQIISLHFKY